MKIATWNVNGINQRLDVLLRWLDQSRPDIFALQETKCVDADFPVAALRDAGYHAAFVGQRTWNGVALLSRGSAPLEARRSLPGDDTDHEARYLEAAIDGLLVASIYLPNGNPQPGPKFERKLAWFERLITHAAGLWDSGLPVILLGDFNVVPTAADIYVSKTHSYRDNALVQPAVREAYSRLLAQGWTDALRTLHPDLPMYTFWSHLRDGWKRDAGWRIDHVLLADPLARRLETADVDREVRGWDKPSDHAPVWIELGALP